jgi:hypothetical protein
MGSVNHGHNHMKTLFLATAVLSGVFVSSVHADPSTTQTIVMVRHGEKPPDGLGQLNCQGLNRALALPKAIRSMFGKPAAIFAPNPGEQKEDEGTSYDYVRPLATIEPTAIALSMPVNAEIGESKIGELQHQLEKPDYVNAVVLIAWEHKEIEDLAKALLKAHGGDSDSVPKWHGKDFDSIYIVKIVRSGSTSAAEFTVGREGLDNQSSTCPGN